MQPPPDDLQMTALLNWDDLRIFLAVARAPTMAAAAARLRIDASTVGRRMARLSATLDADLFEHGPAGHVLTDQGRRLLAHAEAAEQATAAARADLSGERGLLAGTIRVSLPEGLASWIVARHLAGFHVEHPAIRVELVVTNGFLNPSRREADIAIMLARPARGPLLTRKLTDYRLNLYAAQAYLDRRGRPETPDGLEGHTLIGYVPDFIYADELRYLDEVAPGLEPSLVSSSINVQHALTRAGAGLCILPGFIGEQDPALVRLLDGQVAITRSFWLVTHRDARPLARIAAFITWLDSRLACEKAIITGQP